MPVALLPGAQSGGVVSFTDDGGAGGGPLRAGGGLRGMRVRVVNGRGLHSPTFQLTVGALCGIGDAFRGCLGGV
jgi:hypothetical protein